MSEPVLSGEWRDRVLDAAPAEHMGETFAHCPPDCVETEEHRHYQREPGTYYRLRQPVACCGREWMRLDEVLWLDQCRWCWRDHKTLVTGLLTRLVPVATPVRNAPRRRRR
jgi:hypothetical protein